MIENTNTAGILSSGRAMCRECGNVRSVSRRCSLSFGRNLRCAVCSRTTKHLDADAPPAGDWREHFNDSARAEGNRLAREEMFMRDLFAQLAAEIHVRDRITLNGRPCFYSIDRLVNVEYGEVRWVIQLLEALTPAGRIYALSEAWKAMTSRGVARWADDDAYAPHPENGDWVWTGSSQPIGNYVTHEGRRLLEDR